VTLKGAGCFLSRDLMRMKLMTLSYSVDSLMGSDDTNRSPKANKATFV
jgi:hypothetical protein